MTNEVWWRLGCFFSVLIIMLLLESKRPARKPPINSNSRWLVNVGLVVISSVIARLTVPIGLTTVALYNQTHSIGLFNQINMPNIAVLILSLLLLDILIYWQHRLFHQVPMLWRLHKVHHADVHVDATTGFRFHPIEIVLSILIKLVAISVLGVPAIAVLLFEITLSALALFNHTNIRLPNIIEKPLRLILMTQILHRIHHSQIVTETNSNYGFSVIWWDKIFKSYTAEAKKGDIEIDIGLTQYPKAMQHSALWALLIMPFKNK